MSTVTTNELKRYGLPEDDTVMFEQFLNDTAGYNVEKMDSEITRLDAAIDSKVKLNNENLSNVNFIEDEDGNIVQLETNGRVLSILNENLNGLLKSEYSKQMFNLSTVVAGTFFDDINANYTTSDYIKVKPRTRIYVYRYDNHNEINAIAWGVECYDSNKIKQKRIQLATIANYFDNDTSAYIRISCDSSYISLIVVEENEMTITSQTQYHEPNLYLNDNLKVIDNTSNILYRKKLITLGDSITYGAGISDISKNWGSLIAKRNGMIYHNAGISGSTMGEAVDGSNTNACYKNQRYKELENYDYATIWFGWNDYNFCSLGTGTGVDTKKTLDAYYKTLEYIVENYVTLKFGVIIPYLWCYNTDPQDHTIMQLINGIKLVCEKFNVPYLDINRFNFIPSWGSDIPKEENYYVKWDCRQKIFTIDTLHPNEVGNEYLSTIIENFLRSL